MQCGLSTTANIKTKLQLSNEILIQPLTSPTTALETCSFYERSHISSIFPEHNSSLMSNNLQQTPVSNDIVAPIRGWRGGEDEINWCSGIIWAALYHHHPGEINPNITRYKVNPALGSYNVVRGPFMNICLIIQACLPDTRVVKGVVTWSTPWWMN